MKSAVALLIVAGLSGPMFAHRLDEYLQAATISVEKDRIVVGMRFSPGVAITPVVLAGIDRDADGVLSGDEQNGYAKAVAGEVSLRLDGESLPLTLQSKTFPAIEDMQEGRGEIQLQFSAKIPRQHTGARTLTFENHHQSQIGAYLVNALMSSDPDIQIGAQSRNYEQSSYRLDYSQSRVTSPVWITERVLLMLLALVVSGRLAFLWWRRESPASGTLKEC